jgi:competence protein ComEC
MKKSILIIIFLLPSLLLIGQANGNFQMHFINVGQGDAALLISPDGETVLFDEGQAYDCEFPVEYLHSLGLQSIDYLITSHYHDDHIGCTKQILDEFPLQKIAFDRGKSNPSTTFDNYVSAVGSKRQTADLFKRLILDQETDHKVVISFLAMNGAGIKTTNENDMSLVALVSFGELDIMMGGDLSGFNASGYKDIESSVAGKAKQVEIYKVHHHCSEYSSNSTWLDTINPRIGIISVSGSYGRKHEHPAPDCLERLHIKGVRTYWTDDGIGADPDPKWDIIGGDIVVEATPNSYEFMVKFGGNKVDTYQDWGFIPPVGPFPAKTYAWSKNSSVYHYADCAVVRSIRQENLQTGSTPPDKKTLHPGCPK